ncbi:hypothetical protein EC973_003092 [Apophysomyces ossiformis]|uniref:DUF6729 domain-containing protein n=1 Tax=Apophysomyces ossiformis TaxID=679940 RepID=A0A8H7BMW0_9FUNG|nr:hypothetical protein EC973_003092 [Apophysomyces ossiformis]
MSYRYQCKQCGRSYLGHDNNIIQNLPPSLSKEFPAILSHRGAVSRELMNMMRSCFHSGMGPGPVSRAISEYHHLRHDTLELQFMAERQRIAMEQQRGSLANPTFSSFGDKNGYSGTVPSAKYLTDMYNEYVELHLKEHYKHTSTLSATVFNVDHSHKVLKHIGKLGGFKIFDGLLTMNNEYGEIRIQQFVPTTSLEHIEGSMINLAHNLQNLGHTLPKLIFTDKAQSDRRFFENCFPSLRENIQCSQVTDPCASLPERRFPSVDHAIPGLPVTVLSDDNTRVIAHGHIISEPQPRRQQENQNSSLINSDFEDRAESESSEVNDQNDNIENDEVNLELDDQDTDSDGFSGQQVETSFIDQQAVENGQKILTTIFHKLVANPITASEDSRTRVIQDVWHSLKRISVPAKHGLRIEFQRMLTDCILLMDKDDVNKVKSVLQSKGLSFERVLRQRKARVQARVRRVIPPASQLIHSVYKVLMTFGPLKCSATGQPLFNDQAWKEAANFLELVAKGYLSEPSEIPLYYPKYRDTDELTVYRCIRGTNSLEGGVHQNVIRRFGAYNATPRFACNLMTEYRTRHNLDVRVLAI